jgi:hypothetical protein
MRAAGARADYAKAAVLERALGACEEVAGELEADAAGSPEAREALRMARAAAIAEALRSERWSG